MALLTPVIHPPQIQGMQTLPEVLLTGHAPVKGKGYVEFRCGQSMQCLKRERRDMVRGTGVYTLLTYFEHCLRKHSWSLQEEDGVQAIPDSTYRKPWTKMTTDVRGNAKWVERFPSI